MFVGHYAAALAAKAYQPRAPLWAYVAGAQLLDIGWSGLVMAGVEKMRIDPALPGSPLDLYYMPFTHGLPGAVAISVVAALVAKPVLRLPWAASAMVGVVVFSHWLADLLVHRPDLELFPHGEKVGLALWNLPIAEMALEMGLIAVTGAAWVAMRKTRGWTAWPAVLFLAVLTTVQVIGALPSGAESPAAVATKALVVYLVLTAIAWLVERGRPRASEPAAADA